MRSFHQLSLYICMYVCGTFSLDFIDRIRKIYLKKLKIFFPLLFSPTSRKSLRRKEEKTGKKIIDSYLWTSSNVHIYIYIYSVRVRTLIPSPNLNTGNLERRAAIGPFCFFFIFFIFSFFFFAQREMAAAMTQNAQSQGSPKVSKHG